MKQNCGNVNALVQLPLYKVSLIPLLLFTDAAAAIILLLLF